MMKSESVEKLQRLRETLEDGFQKQDYAGLWKILEKLEAALYENFLSEENVQTKLILIGLEKSLDDIKAALEDNRTDDAELYIYVHLKYLMGSLNGFDEKEKVIMDTLNTVTEKLSEIEKKEALISQELNSPENFILRYEKDTDEEIKEIVARVKKTNYIGVFNYDFVDKYNREQVKVFCDTDAEMKYILYQGKRMYFPDSFSEDRIKTYAMNILKEQDEASPHYYYKDGYLVKEGDVVIDAGVAEGNFALSVIEKVKKIYLIECDKEWIKALRKTFAPWEEKVMIVEKFLSDKIDEENITIDALLTGEEVNYIKMDIEGAEREALTGAVESVDRSTRLCMAVCAYHKRGDEAWIKNYLHEHGLQAENTKGYMYFHHDLKARVVFELRRGLVFGRK